MGNLAAARDRRRNWHGCPCAGAAGNAGGGATALRSRLGSAQRLALRRCDDNGSETVRLFLRLRSALRHDRSRAAASKKSEKAERRNGRAQPALDRDTVALIGLKTRARNTWHKMAMTAEIGHATARRRSTYPSARLPLHSAFAPSGRRTGYSCGIGAPRPTRSRVTMTGSRFPGSRVIASDHLPRDFSISSGNYRLRLTAYSCGGSRGFVHLSARTAFPWLALAGTTNHELGIRP
jgi:hypothetical protein